MRKTFKKLTKQDILQAVHTLEGFKLPADGLSSKEWMPMVRDYNGKAHRLASDFKEADYYEYGYDVDDVIKYKLFFKYMLQHIEELQLYYDENN